MEKITKEIYREYLAKRIESVQKTAEMLVDSQEVLKQLAVLDGLMEKCMP